MILKEELKVCIVDTGSLDWKISAENFNEVDDFLMNEIYKDILAKKLVPMPKYKMKERYHGFRVIECDTPRALEYLREVIKNIGTPWKNAALDVKRLGELPSLPKAFIGIPAKSATDDKIKVILQECNPEFPILHSKSVKTEVWSSNSHIPY